MKKNLRDLSPRQRALALTVMGGSLSLVAAAERDLHVRSSAQVRGDKRLWRLLCLNALGAVAYFGWGRR